MESAARRGAARKARPLSFKWMFRGEQLGQGTSPNGGTLLITTHTFIRTNIRAGAERAVSLSPLRFLRFHVC